MVTIPQRPSKEVLIESGRRILDIALKSRKPGVRRRARLFNRFLFYSRWVNVLEEMLNLPKAAGRKQRGTFAREEFMSNAERLLYVIGNRKRVPGPREGVKSINPAEAIPDFWKHVRTLERKGELRLHQLMGMHAERVRLAKRKKKKKAKARRRPRK